MFLGCCNEIAQEFGVFHLIFIIGGGFGFACYYSFWLNLLHRNTESDEFVLPDFPEASTFHVTQMEKVLRLWMEANLLQCLEGKTCFLTVVKLMEFCSTRWRSLTSLDLMYFPRKFRRQVWPIGPVLLAPGSRAGSRRDFRISPEEGKNWLHKKPSCSVLYVSFGSQNAISAPNMMQLAMALEGCGKNFIWVVRPPLGFDINSEFRANEWLPDGFEERIRDWATGS